MLTAKYNKLKVKIDKILKNNGYFPFQYQDFINNSNVFTGQSFKSYWKKAIAVKRTDHFIIDSNGIYHSILSLDLQDLKLPFTC